MAKNVKSNIADSKPSSTSLLRAFKKIVKCGSNPDFPLMNDVIAHQVLFIAIYCQSNYEILSWLSTLMKRQSLECKTFDEKSDREVKSKGQIFI